MPAPDRASSPPRTDRFDRDRDERTLRAFLDALNARDIAAAEALLAPECTLSGSTIPLSPALAGHTLAERCDELAAIYRSWHVSLLRVLRVPSRPVLVGVLATSAVRHGAVQGIGALTAATYEFQDGLIRRVAGFSSPEDALAAVGIGRSRAATPPFASRPPREGPGIPLGLHRADFPIPDHPRARLAVETWERLMRGASLADLVTDDLEISGLLNVLDPDARDTATPREDLTAFAEHHPDGSMTLLDVEVAHTGDRTLAVFQLALGPDGGGTPRWQVAYIVTDWRGERQWRSRAFPDLREARRALEAERA